MFDLKACQDVAIDFLHARVDELDVKDSFKLKNLMTRIVKRVEASDIHSFLDGIEAGLITCNDALVAVEGHREEWTIYEKILYTMLDMINPLLEPAGEAWRFEQERFA